jgi:uncharacterized LabA/DUF88 family protein
MVKEKIYKGKGIDKNKIFPSDLSGSLDDFSRVVIFVDNAYLLRLKKFFFENGLRYSVKSFIENVAGKNNLFIENIFLYDAPPYQSNNPNSKERSMKEDYDLFIERYRKEGIVVREGRTQRLKIGEFFKYGQKGVDMLLGIDMVSILKDYPHLKQVVLLTGDSDFVPVVEKLNSLNVEVVLFTYFDRDRNSSFSRSNHLLNSVSRYIKLTKEDFLRGEINEK